MYDGAVKSFLETHGQLTSFGSGLGTISKLDCTSNRFITVDNLTARRVARRRVSSCVLAIARSARWLFISISPFVSYFSHKFIVVVPKRSSGGVAPTRRGYRPRTEGPRLNWVVDHSLVV